MLKRNPVVEVVLKVLRVGSVALLLMTLARVSLASASEPRCNLEQFDPTERSLSQFKNQIESARAGERFCELARRYVELELQYPLEARTENARLRRMEALAEGEYFEELAAEILEALDRRSSELEDALVLYAKALYAHLPADACKNPQALSGAEGGYTATEEVLDVAAAYLSAFPNGKVRDEMTRLQGQALERLAQHQLCGADFYLDRGKQKARFLDLQAALRRYDDVLKRFGNTSAVATAAAGARAACEALSAISDRGDSEERARETLKLCDRHLGVRR